MTLKLSRLKNWLTLEDSARYLSLIIGEKVCTDDLLQLALQKDLTLSINLVNKYWAVTGKKVSIDESQLHRFPLKNEMQAEDIESTPQEEKRVYLDSLFGEALKFYHSQTDTSDKAKLNFAGLMASAAGSPEADAALYFKGTVLPDGRGVIEFDCDQVDKITGVWNLSMVGLESLDVKSALHGEIEDPGFEVESANGVLLKHPTADRWANIYEPFSNEHVGLDLRDFRLSERLPEGEPLVIRQEELQRFADSLNEPEATPPSDQLKTLHDDFRAFYYSLEELPHCDLLIAAWRKHWCGLSPTDGKRSPTNGEVSRWLTKHPHKPSKNIADAIASIIRPKWAPSGRQPK